ncbi:BnaA04g15800D [Brassica napus]|uniref:(rape) hypothetical protein n=1 Tax=Brassica napus TaxID=3708 RepID=A0A078H1A2_BRANA|nr:unnamed protein product [Brassica napus]CDY30553.1 BnaA04g15800D [Brassica napus]
MIQSSSIIPQPSMKPRKERTFYRKKRKRGRTERPVKLNRDNPDEKPPSAQTRRDAEPKTGDTKLRDTPHPRVKSRPLSAGEERENAGDESRSDEP